jgi:DNA adenine methylase
MSKFFPYLGGKRLLARTIIPLLPEHRLHCEPFSGSATILLEKPPSVAEILNDINGEIITLFRAVQSHPEEFLRQVRWNLRSREEFQRFRDTPPESLTDIQRAARIYFLMRAGYSGKLPDAGCHFAGKMAGSQRPFSIYRIEETVYEIHRRLENVTIERLPYDECLQRYDGQDTLFYCDPPYYGHEKDYGPGIFGREDFTRLAGLLREISGRFLLGINDLPEVREIFVAFTLREVATTYNAGTRHGHGKQAQELLVANFDLPEAIIQPFKRLEKG